MTDAVIVRPASDIPAEDVVVFVMKGAVGAHVGMLYRADAAGERRYLHLAWHHRLQNEPTLSSKSWWIVPCLDDFELADLRTSARLIARRHQDGLVPYSFRPAAAHFDRDGTLRLNDSIGLTCATFVLLVFAHAGIHLLDSATWDTDRPLERRQEDDAAQRELVAYLRKNPESRSQADLVEQEIGCMRIRAEEVAAASGMSGLPVPFARVEPQGRMVLTALG